MAVGLVIEHALAKPDNRAHAQVGSQVCLDLRAFKPRIAVGVEKTLFGDERGSDAVDVDGPAFVDERRTVAIAAFNLEHLECYELILIPRRVQSSLQASPSVEAPVHAAHDAALMDNESRADVAHP